MLRSIATLYILAGLIFPSLTIGGAPEPLAAAALDSLARVYPHERALVLDEWLDLDVRYDSQTDGFDGEMIDGREVWLRAPSILEDFSRVFVRDGPLRRLKELKIEIVSPQGKRRKVKRKDLNWLTRTDRDGMVFHLDREMSYAVIPGLAAGDRVRIEQRYKLEDVPGLPQFRFGDLPSPCIRSSFRLTLPQDHELTFAVRGPDVLKDRLQHVQKSERSRTTHFWRLLGLAARDTEPYSSSEPVNHLVLTPQVLGAPNRSGRETFAISRDWAAAARGYRERIAGTMAATPELESLADRLVADLNKPQQRIDAVYTHVQSSCRYLGLFEGLGGIIPDDAAAVAAKGYGDCKGLGVYLISLLRAVGVEAHPVLVRTRDLGPLEISVPNMTQFNHFIVWADDGQEGAWLDATLDGCPAGVVPPQDAAWPVLSLRPGHEGLHEIPLTAWDPGCMQYDLQGAVDARGVLRLRVRMSATGATIPALRGWSLHSSEADEKKLVSKLLLPVTVPMSALTIEPQAAEDWRRSLQWLLEAEGRRSLPGVQDELFLPKVLPPLPPRALHDAERQSDLDLRGRIGRSETWSITLPEGYRLAAADSLAVSVSGVSWQRRVWQDGRLLQLHREIRWAREILAAQHAAAIVEALDAIEKAESGFFTLTRAKTP